MPYDPGFEKFVGSVKENFHPLKLFLFGSRAWGFGSDSSDYDVLVLTDNSDVKSNDQALKILTKCHPGSISIDLLVRSESELQDRLRKQDPFFKKIIDKGILLYERNS